MSDGNFNRALLPHTPYASGLKTGKAMARQKAMEAFSAWLDDTFPTLSDAERQEHVNNFRRRMSPLSDSPQRERVREE